MYFLKIVKTFLILIIFLQVVLREHVRAHHSGPDPKCHNTLTPYLCKVCGETYSTSEEIVAHIVQHCDENTALRRQPQTGPRKYKRRRKLKTEEPMLGESFDFMDALSDSDDITKKKIQKKVSIKQQYKSNVEEGYQSVLKSFESSLQNINSIVSNSKSNPMKKATKKKIKKEEKKIFETPTTSNTGRPKMIHTQKTRVPVLGTEGLKRGQKTRTLVTKTPKAVLNERNRPRTKNVSCHIEGRQQFAPATFPSNHGTLDFNAREMAMVNVKVEPGLQAVGKRKSPIKRARKKSLSPSKQRLPAKEPLLDLPMTNNGVDIQPTRLFESVMDGSNLEVAFESNNVTTNDMNQESILPDFEKAMNHVGGHMHRGGLDGKINVKIEPNQEDIMGVHDLMGTVEDVPETIIPDAVEYTCEMCLAVFGSRAELLVHVPIHI